MRSSLLSLCVALPLFAGCVGGEKEPVQEDFSDLASMDEKSDSFSYRMTILGSLTYGQTSAAAKYTSSPRFRAYKFAGAKGDKVDIRVRSTDGGDAVAWLLDNSFNVIADNDDAAEGGADSHIKATLTANSNASVKTYYIVYRDYDLHAHKFAVQLAAQTAQPDFFSCNADADCVAVPKHMCCPDCSLEAVNKDQQDAYSSVPLLCPAVLCPLACRLDQRVAQCNFAAHKCQLVNVEDIACGGHTPTPHGCPSGYECTGAGLPVDAPGSCTVIPSGPQTCGGFAGISCPSGQTCIDNPNDSCDLAHGGADCGGICVQANDCRATGCTGGRSCSPCWGQGFVCLPHGAVC